MPEEQIKFIVDKEVANISGHSTGGALDVILCRKQQVQDTGTAYLEFGERTPTDSKAITAAQRKKRKILLKAMTKAGFINYPLEWWHFCYGDQMYTAYTFQKKRPNMVQLQIARTHVA